MKNKHILSVLLVIVLMIISFSAVSAAQPQTDSIRLDFKEFAMAASEEPWWSDLGEALHEDIKYVGCINYKETMPESMQTAYDAMLEWSQSRSFWTIDAEQTDLSNPWYWKVLYLNADPGQAWGICLRPRFHGDASSDLVLEMEVPEGQGGWYRLEMDIVRETVGSVHYLVNSHAGGGRMDVYVNDVLVYDDYDFKGASARAVENLGLVELRDGKNTIRLHSALGLNGTTSYNERCSYDLRAMEFIPLHGTQVGPDRDVTLRLQDTYLPYSAVIDDTYTLRTTHAAVVTAAFTDEGELLICGHQEGQGAVVVSKDGEELFSIPVTVTEDAPQTQNKLYYRLDGAYSLELPLGDTAEGDLHCITTLLTALMEEDLRREGTVYFESSDPTVAAVDQASGDVTAVGEGMATVTAYCDMGEVSSASAVVTVKDTASLEALTVSYPRAYMGVGQSVSLQIGGKKASGAKADMTRYDVSWSVDDEALASVTQTGRLTAIAEGTVTVTAAVGEVQASFAMQIVANEQMPGEDYRYELHHGKALVLEQGSLELDGIAWNEELTNCDAKINDSHGITVAPCYPGMQVALDFYLPKSGWYTANTFGTTFSWGGLADVFIDRAFMGQMDFDQDRGHSYNAPGPLNTVWLEVGYHTIVLRNVRSGYFWWGGFELERSEDPGPIRPILSAKKELLAGETTELSVSYDLANEKGFYLKQVTQIPTDYTNYCTIASSDPSVVAVDGDTLTAVGLGTATIVLEGEAGGRPVREELEITVVEGSVLRAELTAEKTTLKPTEQGVRLELTACGTDGAAVELPVDAQVDYLCEDTAVASVDAEGFVTITGAEGSAEIRATVTEGARQIEAAVWITVTAGKTEPTVYTYEERENALENVSKYSWAWNMKEAAVKKADFAVAHLDTYYELITHEGILRNGRVGHNADPEALFCRYCKADLGAIYNHYPYEVDPIGKPWKITCPECKRDFPSNDFESFYKLGLDEQGRFSRERAIANGGEQYLVNELYPEMGEGWGVDDGFGYRTGKVYDNGVEETHFYIAYYLANFYYPLNSTASQYSLMNMMNALRDAYLYTGDETYGHAGAVLLDRLADVYPDMNYWENSVSRDRGKIMDAICEGGSIQQTLATCADAFWDCFDDAEVVDYLRSHHVLKGIADPESITPETIRDHIDQNILLQIRDAIEHGQSHGNTGMSEAAMGYAAVALDHLPETAEMIDWIFRCGETRNVDSSTGEQLWTGGSVMSDLVSLVDRDGFGNEGAITYNRMWYQNYLKLADALDGYDRVKGADLWTNPKFLDLFIAMDRITVLGNCAILTGEAGHMQGRGYYPEVSALLELFANTTSEQTAHAQAARILYVANGRRVDDLHADIFTKDPASGLQNEILQIVEEQGEYSASESNMLCGHGLAILRNGPETFIKGENAHAFSSFWMYFGMNGGAHGAWETLALGVDAYGLNFTGGTGYPKVVNTYDAEREQWMRRTLSHNTVMVDHASQLSIAKNSFPLHFDDADTVKVMDAEAAQAYAQTDIYRRTVVTVALAEEEYYAVDFFRVLGGRDHVYSFHAHTMQEPETEGLDFVHQPMGTYAGPDVPLGASYPNPYSNEVAANVDPYGVSTAASWLDNVYRDSEPDTAFTIDLAIEDFADRLPTSVGLGMRLTMLSEEPMTEVAIADGHPTANGLNPDFVKYALIRHSGGNDLDTLFTAVIEPYQYAYRIAASELVEVELVEGTPGLTDTAAAVKVTRLDGQVDYIVYATNVNCTYEVDGKFRFKGFVGVCSYVGEKCIYAYGNEAEMVGDLLTEALACVTGCVVDFTKGLSDTYTMTVQLDMDVAAEQLKDRYIYVENDREENGAYRIYGAEVMGDTAVLDLRTQSLARRYVDGTNMALGFVHNIQEGQSFTIPLSADAAQDLCDHTGKITKYTYNGDMTHSITVSCRDCAKPLSERVRACTDKDLDAKCDICGGTLKTIQKASFAGSNMTLGNELEVNFLMVKKNLADGDYTAYITQHMADGTEKVTEIAMADWNTMGSTYHKISARIAAKEMADELSIEIRDAEGNVCNEAYSTSVRGYAGRALASDTTTELVRIMMVDMLNYGAAAQAHFKYNTADLANNALTEEQQALATAKVACINKQVKDATIYGANLSLEDSILLNTFFKGLKGKDIAKMYAMVSFTDFQGIAKEVRMEGSEFEKYGSSGDIYKIVVDDVVLADAKTLVTVTLYNADGTVFGAGTDSVESYVARAEKNNADTYGLYANIMKFATSAYNYITNK